jgi:hypothetical protein
MRLGTLLKKIQNFNGGIHLDIFVRNVMLLAFLTWNVIEGAVFENEYPSVFVKLYTIPVWRLLLVLLIICAALWNHSLGIMVSFTLFFYVMDMEVTMNKWK